MRDITQLFFSVDPEEITDEEMEKVIIPYMREQRGKFLTTESKGERAPSTKRVAPPKDISIADLDLSNLKF